MEIYNNWIMIETIPLTSKTLSDLATRIPNSVMWRPVFLNEVIKTPKFSVEEWSEKIPTFFLDYIIYCIQDIVGKYMNDEQRLNELLEQSLENSTLEEVNEVKQERDYLLDRLASIDNDFGCFEYNKYDLKKLRKSSIKKPKPLYIG